MPSLFQKRRSCSSKRKKGGKAEGIEKYPCLRSSSLQKPLSNLLFWFLQNCLSPWQFAQPSISMASGDLLGIEPQELKFPFEVGKQISCSIQLSNRTDNCVAFKVKTTNPKKYCVRPNAGIVMPRSTCDVTVMMQAQREAPPDMQCKDKFLLQSVVANPGTTAKDITPEMFNKESGNHVDECKLRVIYVAPPKPPSPVPEGSEEDASPPRDPPLDALDFSPAARGLVGTQDKSSEAKALISQLTEDKNSAIQLNGRLRQELELLRREVSKKQGSFSFVFVVLIGLLGILCGYLLRSS